MVNMPITHDSIRTIAFQLPDSGAKVPIPCRLVRSSGNGKEGEQVLGLEFQYEAEAQLLLIEKYMQDSLGGATDYRQVPRTACRLRNVEIDRQGVEVQSIDNLSTEGGLISFRGTLQPGDEVTLLITLYDDPRRLRLMGEVVYVLEKAFERESAAGIRFRGLRVSESARLRNLIIACCSGSALSEIHQLFRTRPAASEHRISGSKAIFHVLSELQLRQVSLSLLVEGSLYIQERQIDSLQQEEERFTVYLPTNGGMPSLLEGIPYPPAYFAFYWKGSSHYFKATVTTITSDTMELRFPEAIYRSDKRSYKRKTLELSSAVQLFPEPTNGFDHSDEGELLDISRRGFLCEIPHGCRLEEALRARAKRAIHCGPPVGIGHRRPGPACPANHYPQRGNAASRYRSRDCQDGMPVLCDCSRNLEHRHARCASPAEDCQPKARNRSSRVPRQGGASHPGLAQHDPSRGPHSCGDHSALVWEEKGGLCPPGCHPAGQCLGSEKAAGCPALRRCKPPRRKPQRRVEPSNGLRDAVVSHQPGSGRPAGRAGIRETQ